MSQRANLVRNHLIKKQSFARRPAPQTQAQNLQGDDLAARGKRHYIADSDRRAGLLDTVSVQPDMPFDRLLLRYVACLAEARMPEPFVDA